MSARGNRGSGLVAAVIFIVLEIAAAAMLSKTSTLQNIWINRASHRALAFAWAWTDGAHDYMTLRSTNERLALENFELSRQLDYYHNLYPEEKVDAVNGDGTGRFRYVPATIVKISRNTQHNYVIIDKGLEDGISPHSGIITKDGVVGVIDAVDKHFSYGLTLQNSKIAVSARIGKTGPMAALSWDGLHSEGAILKGVPLHWEVTPGDTVYTSGISDLFPGDIPLGVIRKSRIVNGVSGEYSVDMFLHFSEIRYVTVVSNPNRAEMEMLEKEEEEI